MQSLQSERDELVASGEINDDACPDILLLYRRKVEELERVLEDPEREEAMSLVQSMIEQVELSPRHDGSGLDTHLLGGLAAILGAYEQLQDTKNPAAERRGGR